nr:hypothetical protein Iba_chr09aCG12670 [Ipomoea batatas]
MAKTGGDPVAKLTVALLPSSSIVGLSAREGESEDDDGGRCPAIAIDQGRRPPLKVRQSSVRRWSKVAVVDSPSLTISVNIFSNPFIDRSAVMEPSPARSHMPHDKSVWHHNSLLLQTTVLVSKTLNSSSTIFYITPLTQRKCSTRGCFDDNQRRSSGGVKASPTALRGGGIGQHQRASSPSISLVYGDGSSTPSSLVRDSSTSSSSLRGDCSDGAEHHGSMDLTADVLRSISSSGNGRGERLPLLRAVCEQSTGDLLADVFSFISVAAFHFSGGVGQGMKVTVVTGVRSTAAADFPRSVGDVRSGGEQQQQRREPLFFLFG